MFCGEERIMLSGSEVSTNHAQSYAAACAGVIQATNAVLEIANRASGARRMSERSDQHEISRKNFLNMAVREEQAFVPPYKAFVAACTAARDAASTLSAACESLDPDRVLLSAVGEENWSQAGVAAHILRANFGPTPVDFLKGLEAANAAMQADIFDFGEAGFIGHVFTAAPPAEAVERACPWCAETIKSAAIICRFCGRDV